MSILYFFFFLKKEALISTGIMKEKKRQRSWATDWGKEVEEKNTKFKGDKEIFL